MIISKLSPYYQELYRALRKNGDTHSQAVETIKAEKQVAAIMARIPDKEG